MKKIILMLLFISIIVFGYLYYSYNNENNINLKKVDENSISDNVSNWLKESKESKGANIFIEKQDSTFKYFLYYEASDIGYYKYDINASYNKNELIFEIYKNEAYNETDIKISAFYSVEIPQEAEKIIVKLDGTIIDWK